MAQEDARRASEQKRRVNLEVHRTRRGVANLASAAQYAADRIAAKADAEAEARGAIALAYVATLAAAATARAARAAASDDAVVDAWLRAKCAGLSDLETERAASRAMQEAEDKAEAEARRAAEPRPDAEATEEAKRAWDHARVSAERHLVSIEELAFDNDRRGGANATQAAAAGEAARAWLVLSSIAAKLSRASARLSGFRDAGVPRSKLSLDKVVRFVEEDASRELEAWRRSVRDKRWADAVSAAAEAAAKEAATSAGAGPAGAAAAGDEVAGDATSPRAPGPPLPKKQRMVT